MSFLALFKMVTADSHGLPELLNHMSIDDKYDTHYKQGIKAIQRTPDKQSHSKAGRLATI